MAKLENETELKNKRRRWLIVAGILVVVVVLSALTSLRPRRIRVQVAQAARQDITSTITTNGKVEPTQNFEAHAPFGTTVKKILVHEGDRVRRGQLLLQLEDSEARSTASHALAQLRAAESVQASVQAGGTREEVLTRNADLVKAQAELDASRRNLEALRRLQQRGAASDAEVQAAEDRLRRAEADLKLLQQKGTGRYSKEEMARVQADIADSRAAYEAAQAVLANANVTAPFDGTVYAIPVRQGAFVNGGDLVIQVADLREVQVRAFVDEPEIGRLKPGQVVRVTWDAIPGRVWQGKLTSTPTTVVSRGTRMVAEFTCQVDNDDLKLLPNVNVGVAIITASHNNALSVPREAVHEEDGKHYMYLVDGSRLDRREVQIGTANLTHIEITEGLKDSDMFALASLSPTPIRDGVSVKIVE
ncbi:MAG TPA: efflux RND transporter periplasmic adaptor subunit [Clostridia bacterium]|nr:efflux RND transporter periplasmic adaptor subunit [Clostridia bacterium]